MCVRVCVCTRWMCKMIAFNFFCLQSGHKEIASFELFNQMWADNVKPCGHFDYRYIDVRIVKRVGQTVCYLI